MKKDISNEELDELEFYMNIELKIDDMTIILKNIDILSLNNVNKYELLRSVMCDVDWYTVELYGITTILNEKYVLIERTKKKLVLVKGYGI